MLASARALLEHLIDFAGMFPPARLPLPEALRHYTRLLATPEAWMLGRFVCAAVNLGEVGAAGGPPGLEVAALGRGGRDLAEFAGNLDADLQAIHDFRTGRVDAIEMTLPSIASADELARWFDYLDPRVAIVRLRAFVEIPITPTWQHDVDALRAVLGRLAVLDSSRPSTVGLKIRCGGPTIPSVEQVAFFIACCREARLPWKATAGLHHPLRHRDLARQTMAHGFLNLFGAGVLDHVHSLNQRQIAAILQEESITAFRFTDEHFGWRDWDCTVEQIRAARRWMPSFGSCSFDEPCDDLRGLGLIP